MVALGLAGLILAPSLPADDDERGRRSAPELPAPVCDTVNVPAGQKVASHLYATGVQIYQWNGASWVFVAPEASLFADPCYERQVGTHYAGPTWEAEDGSRVIAARMDGCTPNPGAIPWLLLGATSTEGAGRFARVSYIQRVNTIGGTAPAEPGGVVGDEARVPYTAEYYFYRASSGAATPDVVTEWNLYWEEAVFATAQPVPAQGRSAAIVHLAIFEALNGIERRFTPYYITQTAPPGAHGEAAAMQAGYTALRALYPAQATALDRHRTDSLARINGARGKSQSIAKGLAWGEHVANQILQFRSTDHWTEPQPPFMGGFELGQWRSIAFDNNPDGALPAVFPQIAVLTPFAMSSPSHFRPGPPYGAPIPDALKTAQYAADLEEVKIIGRVDSGVRTAEQTLIARLWQAMGPVDENRAARSVVAQAGPGHLGEKARLFALLNMAGCDALIIGWDSKFAYHLWRPHHAIRLADTDGNPATTADANWSGLILAPRFPEYVSNHSTLTAAMMRVLARELGDEHAFTLESPLLPGFSQSYSRFSEAAAQAKEARIWAGIHFRTACELGEQLGVALADYVIENYLTRRSGR